MVARDPVERPAGRIRTTRSACTLLAVAVFASVGCALDAVRTRYSTPGAAAGSPIAPPTTPVWLGGGYHASVGSNAPFAREFRSDPARLVVFACTLRRSALLWFLVPPLPPIPHGAEKHSEDGVPRLAMPARLTVVVAIEDARGIWSVDPHRVRLQRGSGSQEAPFEVSAREDGTRASGVLRDFELCGGGGNPVPLPEETRVRVPATLWFTFGEGSGPDQRFTLTLDGLSRDGAPVSLPPITFSPGAYTYSGFVGP